MGLAGPSGRTGSPGLPGKQGDPGNDGKGIKGDRVSCDQKIHYLKYIFSSKDCDHDIILGSPWSSRSKRITWWSRCTRFRCTNSGVLPGKAMNDSLMKRMTHKWWVIKQSALKNQKPIKACLHVTFNFSIYSYMLRDVITWPHVISFDQSKFIWPHVTPCDTS